MNKPQTQCTFEARRLIEMILFVRLFVGRLLMKEVDKKKEEYAAMFCVSPDSGDIGKYEDLWILAGGAALSFLPQPDSHEKIYCLSPSCIDALISRYLERTAARDGKFFAVIFEVMPFMTSLNPLINTDDQENLDYLQSTYEVPMDEDDAEKLIWRIRNHAGSLEWWPRFVHELSTHVLLATFQPGCSSIGNKRADYGQFGVIQSMFNTHVREIGLLSR